MPNILKKPHVKCQNRTFYVLYAASQVIAHPLPHGRGSAVDSEPRASASGLEPRAGINGAAYNNREFRHWHADSGQIHRAVCGFAAGHAECHHNMSFHCWTGSSGAPAGRRIRCDSCRRLNRAPHRRLVMPQSPGDPRGISFSLSRAVVENGSDKLKLIPQGIQHLAETEKV